MLGGGILFVLFLAYSPTGKPATLQREFFLSDKFGLVRREFIRSASNRRGLSHLPRKLIFETDAPGIEAYLLDLSRYPPEELVQRMLSLTEKLEAGQPPQGPDLLLGGKILNRTVWQLHSWPWALAHPTRLLLVKASQDSTLKVKISYGRD